ncbi:hypothetical protein G7B40_015460 [Aetokthonos hydrillicola Thurmond2011]|jgi:hypothetical protein|uniref:Uncharacterized protein n=1 Tax=Aetokthonos hydrillicola Thurmond2011 TaxID=2712845 RepID=A0AAP5IBC9_9CYAN|nr:hypothetical protein [Aetokthonos hydrillicola]MBO3461671.1 hypothetical protein [Aetokthonos hydrillicola CCALA 1050]MBW4588716.1 hypothetical protein [Aetokthonos hydrillicola CCALA 1050]MDR9895950.1 hypothetical protein [Aetokthonos hydrillicola Thurmond2011]
MKDKYIRVRTSERRLNKLRLYAAIKEKTMTQVIDEFIDSLKIPEAGDSDARSPLASPLGRGLEESSAINHPSPWLSGSQPRMGVVSSPPQNSSHVSPEGERGMNFGLS